MATRFIAIWLRYLKTDWFTVRRQELKNIPFVLAAPDHGRMVITDANALANNEGIFPGMSLADARALFPSLQFLDDIPGLNVKILRAIALWCIRFSPCVSIDEPDGLVVDATGCAHLWGGEESYLAHISTRIKKLGYDSRMTIACTAGAAWAHAHFGKTGTIKPGELAISLSLLPPAALRLPFETIELMQKLGLRTIGSISSLPRNSLKRRFGKDMLQQLDLALGNIPGPIFPVEPIPAYHERLPCLEPITTATGIEIALKRLLETICQRLQSEEKGLRSAFFKCYRVDGKIETVHIGTNRATHNINHLFKLFEIKLPGIEPAAGIELFVLECAKVEELLSRQEKIWNAAGSVDDFEIAELLDRIENKTGVQCVHRYLPDEHHWPERSIRPAISLAETITTKWRDDTRRPVQILSRPEPVEVAAPVPDYPPMLFRYKGKLHKIKRADGPERIEREWWIEEGPHRDYYVVEDEDGQRYWLFRSGHYDAEKNYQWYVHGFFA